ncbi:MAG TPA: protein kinase, partial [Candidatus Krumholzibacteria bacterium]
MQLEPGTLLLHYRLVDKVGEGGMGVVWRAVDTTLDRHVAIKILPDVFANDPDRAARFDREAKVLASLNHPNITTVHSVHHVDSVRFLVMEFAHGGSLADRIARGRIPLDEALVIARQIALAIEAAHENGVIHRDLKPANVTVTDDNKVEVLDFGLAKALDPAGGGAISDLSKSPTLASGHTAAGMILGTAAYMSPEQARGKTVDRRTDIWSFGCVLYETLTGQRAFDGETVTDVLAAVVTRDPDWSQLPPATPARIQELLRRCLEKDPQRRLRDAGEIRIAIEDVIAHPRSGVTATPAPVVAQRHRRVWPWLVVAGMATLVALALIDRQPGKPADATHLSVALPPTDVLEGGAENMLLNVSPDGRTVVYAAHRGEGTRLFVRRLDEGEPVPLDGTEGAHSPFFSPDGQWIAFVAQSKLRKISVNGGPVFDICDVGADRSGVWLDDGSIVMCTHATTPLMRVASSGGTLNSVTALDTASGERTHRWPDALPGSEWVIFTVGVASSPGSYEDATIAAASLRTSERRVLVEHASMARYCAPGYLLFSRQGALLAAPFDASNPKVNGPTVPVFDRIDREPSSGAVHFAVARNGTLVFAPRVQGSDETEMLWVSLDGNVTVIPAPPREYSSPRISPDGKEICVTIGPTYGIGDIWRFNIARQSLTRLTFDGRALVALWTPDQRGIVYQTEDVAFNIATLSLGQDDPPRSIFHEKAPVVISGLTPDGKTIVFSPWGTTDGDVLAMPVTGGDVETLVSEPMDQSDATVSPDGAWFAYVSRAGSITEVCVRAYPKGATKWQVSTGGGSMPLWSPTRKELYFTSSNSMFAASYEVTGRSIAFDAPRRLFTLPPGRGNDADVRPYDITPDGSRFLMTRIAR